MAEQSARPATTGTRESATCGLVRSLSMKRAITTVKKGADDLIVSVNETATYFRESSPSITVTKRISPTAAMSSANERSGCDESGLGCTGPTPVSHGPYILSAPNAAVIVICESASVLGSACSVAMMCLLPNKVPPLHTYHAVMKIAIRVCTEYFSKGPCFSSLPSAWAGAGAPLPSAASSRGDRIFAATVAAEKRSDADELAWSEAAAAAAARGPRRRGAAPNEVFAARARRDRSAGGFFSHTIYRILRGAPTRCL